MGLSDLARSALRWLLGGDSTGQELRAVGERRSGVPDVPGEKPVMYAYCLCDHTVDKHDADRNCMVPRCQCDMYLLGTYSTAYDATPTGIPIVSLGPLPEPELDVDEVLAEAIRITSLNIP